MKYELIKIEGKTFFQIRALKDFGNVKKGDFGGLIESEKNLSQEGDCWVYENARVFGGACVSDNALILGDTRIYGDAYVCGNAQIFDNALIFGNALVFGCARVYGNALVFENARVYGNALVFGYARVFGNARVFGEVKIGESIYISFGRIKNNGLKSIIQASCNLSVTDDKIIAYKIVRKTDNPKIFVSERDANFKYEIGKVSKVENPDLTNASCSSGIHVSHLNYWTSKTQISENEAVYIKVEVNLEDVITCQDGKIRCKKVKVLNKEDYE